jgi:hypothetical protein
LLENVYYNIDYNVFKKGLQIMEELKIVGSIGYVIIDMDKLGIENEDL